MSGLIGKKVGMTNIYDSKGRLVPCTVLEAGPCVVSQVKTTEKDGYTALQLSFKDKKEKNTPNALKGHFAKAKTTPKAKVVEFKEFTEEKTLGEILTIELFAEGDFVDITGTSKGKGFQGVVKRHGFGGVGGSSHGQHDRQRAPGSLGASSFPSRVFKGMKMAGQTGNRKSKALNLQVIKIMPEKNLLLVKGGVPGSIGSFVKIEK